jgi:hypothetical protein
MLTITLSYNNTILITTVKSFVVQAMAYANRLRNKEPTTDSFYNDKKYFGVVSYRVCHYQPYLAWSNICGQDLDPQKSSPKVGSILAYNH